MVVLYIATTEDVTKIWSGITVEEKAEWVLGKPITRLVSKAAVAITFQIVKSFAGIVTVGLYNKAN